jgi:ATP adenylyltransferase
VTGRLRERAAELAARALASGALQPIETQAENLRDGGIEFIVRVVSSLARKQAVDSRPPPGNPFLDPDPALLVGDLTPTHRVLLNKFNALDGHLLIVTRVFESQEAPLNPQDFEAAFAVLSETDGLVFYNAGRPAGASQPHKHLQFIPVPLPQPLPVGACLQALPPVGAWARSPSLAFAHAASRTPQEPRQAQAVYRHLLQAIGRESSDYNLLMTREWMMAVPRRHSEYAGISVNALGFAGLLLLREHGELDVLRHIGPMHLLREVSAEA